MSRFGEDRYTARVQALDEIALMVDIVDKWGNMRLKDIRDESGFTLIELLVVILIIGILAAIAVPVFLNQRKKGVEASVQSDLKNAALAMESEMVNNKQKYLSYLPNYNPQSQGVRISLDAGASSADQYCILGTSEAYPEMKYYYDSTRGGVLKKGEICTPLPAGSGSFTNILSGKKALIVGTWGDATPGTAPKNFLLAKGFGTVDIKDNPPVSEYAGYDLIVAMGSNGTIKPQTYINLIEGYNQGYRILTDGNDSQTSTLPFITKTKTFTSGSTEFKQTGNTSLSPSFPYAYSEPTFVPDVHWLCPLEMKPEMVTIATGPGLSSNDTCITASAMQSGNGRWVHLITAPMRTQNGITAASVDWLML